MSKASIVVLFDERCALYSMPGHPERPFRVTSTAERLKKQQHLALDWRKPNEATVEALQRAHAKGHVEHVRDATSDFDGDTPCYPDIYHHALRASGAALDAMRLALKGESAFSLMRPPGHHAMRERAMGFCYFSSMAVATLEAAQVHGKRVAVLDFDVHHGNGTEDVLLGKENVMFASIHQSPCYPGTGREHRPPNVRNYPVPPETPPQRYREYIEAALRDIRGFKPDLLGVSAGFDAYVGDPIAQERLEIEDFEWIGRRVAELKVPAFHLLEGGYSDRLTELVESYLYGLHGVSVG